MGILGRVLSLGEKRIRIPYCAAVVPAAGCSARMNSVNKLFVNLSGVPVLAYTLTALQQSPYINEIVIAAREDDIAAVAEMCEKYGIDKVRKVVCGGATRFESVFIASGYVSAKAKLIAVHDGARPFVTQQIIADTVKAAALHNAAAPAVEITDTVKTLKNGYVVKTVDRESTVRIQTPQVFRTEILKAALSNASKKGIAVTDECMAAEEIGVFPFATRGSEENIKITVPADIEKADRILEKRGTRK